MLEHSWISCSKKYDKQTHPWEPRREKCFEYIVEFLCVFLFRLLRWPQRCSRKGQKGRKSLCWHVCLWPAMLSSSTIAQAQIPQVLVTWERRETDEGGGENVSNLSERPRLWLWNEPFGVWESCLGSSGQTVEEVKFRENSSKIRIIKSVFLKLAFESSCLISDILSKFGKNTKYRRQLGELFFVF